jgi:hypothetical protein
VRRRLTLASASSQTLAQAEAAGAVRAPRQRRAPSVPSLAEVAVVAAADSEAGACLEAVAVVEATHGRVLLQAAWHQPRPSQAVAQVQLQQLVPVLGVQPCSPRC